MKSCRVCNSPIEPFHSFGRQPLANGFLTAAEFPTEYFFELKVAFCDRCKMFQLVDQPEPERMFHDAYAFFSGTSKVMAEHFREFAESVRTKYLGQDPFVVEIGSNDGICLGHFAKAGIRHLGVEPSANVAKAARDKGIQTLCAFFNKDTAERIRAEHGPADAFLAANVMCHIADIHSVVEGIAVLLKPDGICTFEDPYLGDVVEKTSYDQIYDEHVFLFSAMSISSVFAPHGMELVDLAPQPTHGGSLRYTLARKGKRKVAPRVAACLEREKALGLHRISTFEQFHKSCERSKTELVKLLRKLKAEKKRVVGYAATSKSTSVLNYCGIGPDLIEFISDSTPIKQGKFTPGAHIPVAPPEKFRDPYPDYAVLFGWNHMKEILDKESEFTARGGKWIVFVPKVEVL